MSNNKMKDIGDKSGLMDSQKAIVTQEINDNKSHDLDELLNTYFRGRVVRKDLTKQPKEGANVPVYVLEYLLGMYIDLSVLKN